MTISVFDLYLSRIPVHRTERMMDMSQASLYAQMTAESRSKIWNSWSNLIGQINTFIVQQDAKMQGHSPITWNGQILNIKQLKEKFKTTWGKRSVR
jgi:hypothetical protein